METILTNGQCYHTAFPNCIVVWAWFGKWNSGFGGETQRESLEMAMWEKKNKLRLPQGNSLEGLESRVIIFEGVSWGNSEGLWGQVPLFAGAGGNGQDPPLYPFSLKMLTACRTLSATALGAHPGKKLLPSNSWGTDPTLRSTKNGGHAESLQEQHKLCTYTENHCQKPRRGP